MQPVDDPQTHIVEPLQTLLRRATLLLDQYADAAPRSSESLVYRGDELLDTLASVDVIEWNDAEPIRGSDEFHSHSRVRFHKCLLS